MDFDTKRLVGLTYKEATELASEYGFVIRPLMVDGELLMGTMDYCLDRINVTIDRDTITSIFSIG